MKIFQDFAKMECDTSMAGAVYQNALLCEQNEKNVLRELFEVKCNGDEAILDALIEKSKKKLKEFRPHIEVLENTLGCERKKGKKSFFLIEKVQQF